MSTSKKIASAAIWSIIANIINAIYGFISVPILIGYFGKADYGLIGLATSVNVYMQLMDLGFNSTNVRYFSLWISQSRITKVIDLFRTSLAFYGTIGLINGMLLLIICLLSGHVFNVTEDQNYTLKVFLVILSFSAVVNWYTSCLEQVIKATENVAWIQRYSILPRILMIAILAGTLLLKLDIYTYFALTTLSYLVVVPLQIIKIKKELPYIRFLPKYNYPILREILPYSLSIFSFGLFQFTFHNVRPVFLGILGSVEDVADYRIMNGIAHIIMIVSSVFMGAILPSATKITAEENSEAYYKLAYSGTRYLSFFLCFCVFGFICGIPELLTVYVGSEYLYLVPWMIVWFVSLLGNHIQCISALVFAGTQMRPITIMSCISSIIGLLCAWLLIPYYGVGAISISLFVYTLLQGGFYYTYYWPRYLNIQPLKVLTYSFMPAVLCGVISTIIVYLIPVQQNALEALFIKAIAFALLYIITVVFILNNNDKKYIMSIFKR